MKLGIDIGRVIIAPDGGGKGDTSFIGGSLDDALSTPPYKGMFEAVPELVRLFEGRVWLISKCRQRVQDKTRKWLSHHRFFERTGIGEDRLRFCLERPQKAVHCREIGITHFVDDRLDVLDHLDGVVRFRYLFGPQRTGTLAPAGIRPVPSWVDASREITADVRALGLGG